MKRILSLIVLTSMLLLSGCGWQRSEDFEIGFFDNEYLSECSLLGIPTPSAQDIRHEDDKAFCTLTDEELSLYIRDVAAFIMEKDDIYHKGYHFETGNPGGIFFLPEYRFAPLTEDTDTSVGWFAFSLTEQLSDGTPYNRFYHNGVSVRVYRETDKRGSFSYNTVIKIDDDASFMAYYEGDYTS